MDKPEALDFLHLLGAGVLMMLLLVIIVVVFVITHQKRAHLLQAKLRQQELNHQTAMLQSVVASQESERERIAQDLHDEIGASLATARLFVNQVGYEMTVPHLQVMSQQASHILGDTVQSLRHIVQNLSPAALERFGFCRAVTMLGRHLEDGGLRVELHIHEAVETLALTVQLALYRIVQEIFANVTKHAQAQCLVLQFQPEDDALLLTVTDDGCGFSPALTAPSAKPIGMGLSGIRARAKMLNGHLEIASALGSGTRITLRLPR